MELCSRNHNEVCYEGRDCPVCLVIAKKDRQERDLEVTINQLEKQIQSLEERLEDALANW